MQHEHAVDMLASANMGSETKQLWADLGCGSGTFTLALADLLPVESVIHAMDMSSAALKSIPAKHNTTTIIKTTGNFVTDTLPATMFNGILMANALHYVEHQAAFVERVATYLEPAAGFLIVEYDTDGANQWVPYPLTFIRLKKLFNGAGFSRVHKLSERPSAFGRAMLYAAQITR